MSGKPFFLDFWPDQLSKHRQSLQKRPTKWFATNPIKKLPFPPNIGAAVAVATIEAPHSESFRPLRRRSQYKNFDALVRVTRADESIRSLLSASDLPDSTWSLDREISFGKTRSWKRRQRIWSEERWRITKEDTSRQRRPKPASRTAELTKTASDVTSSWWNQRQFDTRARRCLSKDSTTWPVLCFCTDTK